MELGFIPEATQHQSEELMWYRRVTAGRGAWGREAWRGAGRTETGQLKGRVRYSVSRLVRCWGGPRGGPVLHTVVSAVKN